MIFWHNNEVVLDYMEEEKVGSILSENYHLYIFEYVKLYKYPS